MTDYYSFTLEVDGNKELARVCELARSMPSYHRIYIDDRDGVWPDDDEYCVEILFTNEQDATLFSLKL